MSKPDTPIKCRRCSECRGATHHWLENDDFGNEDELEPEAPIDVLFVCKHCPALGDECEACDGTGDRYDDPEYGCPRCGGSGIVERAPIIAKDSAK